MGRLCLSEKIAWLRLILMKIKSAFAFILVISASLLVGLVSIAAAYVLPQKTSSLEKTVSAVASGPIENAGGLDHFFRELAAGHPVRAMHYGDSHTKADIFTGEIRRNLQRDFGDSTRYTRAT